MVDVDLDTPLAVKLAGRFLPPTLTSGRDSVPDSHWWYFAEGTQTQTFRDTDQRKKLIEFRSTGCQTVVEPSKHPDGDHYRWNRESGLEAAEVDSETLHRQVRMLATAVLIAKHLPPPRGQKTDEGGGRHDYAMALAGFLLNEDRLPEEDVLAVLTAAWDTTAWQGEQQRREAMRDLRGIVKDTDEKIAAGESFMGGGVLNEMVPYMPKSLAKYWNWTQHGNFANFANHISDKKEVPEEVAWEAPVPFHEYELPEFPTDVLSKWAAEFVRAEARITQTPEDLAGVLVLTVGSLALAKLLTVEPWPGWRESVNLYTAVAMPPGSRKSVVFSHVTAPIHDFEASKNQILGAEIALAETKRKVLEERVKKAQQKAAKAGPEDVDLELVNAMEATEELQNLEVPEPLRLLADDATPEALAKLMKAQRGRMALLSPEGDVFDIMAGRYSQQVPNLGVYLRGHAGDPVRIDRVSSPPEMIKSASLTIGLAVQPDVLHGLADKPGFRGRGLIGRFLYSLPADLLGQRTIEKPQPVPARVLQEYRRCVRDLLDLAPEDVTREELEPTAVRLSDAAQEKLLEYMRWIEPQLAASGDLGTMTDWAGKLAGAVVRLAGILHMMKLAGEANALQPLSIRGDRFLPAAAVERAIHLANYFVAHAQAAFAEMGADPTVESAKHILRWIERKGVTSFSKREAFESLKKRFHKASAMQPGLDLLVDHGHIRPVEPKGGRGRPSERYAVNPTEVTKIVRICGSQNSQNSQK